MAPIWNPHGIEDGMIVRSIVRPARAFRVSGIPSRAGTTVVGITPGARTVMNGSARNYRPETAAEEVGRIGAPVEDARAEALVAEAVEAGPVRGDAAASYDCVDDEDVPTLCVRMQDAVARIADGDCDPGDAAAIVSAAAALNAGVARRRDFGARSETG